MLLTRLVQAKRGHFIALIAAIAIVMVVVVGCESSTSFVPVSDPNGTAATFVGNDAQTCGSCHNEIATQYATQKHGQDFHTAHAPSDLILDRNGACAACHTVGFGEGGYVNTSTPQFEQIGCEECHGKASKHVANPSPSNITRVPDAENSCWDCHVDSYKTIKNNPQAKTDADFYNSKPQSVAAHHPQALMVAGVKGYNRNNEPDAHRYIDNTCVTCHMQPSGSPVAHDAASLQVDMSACASCHANAAALKTELQEGVKAKLIQLGGESATEPGEPDETGSGGMLGAYMAANPGIDWNNNNSPDSDVVKKFKAARYDWDYVLADKSEGVHNPKLAGELLDDAISLLQLPD